MVITHRLRGKHFTLLVTASTLKPYPVGTQRAVMGWHAGWRMLHTRTGTKQLSNMRVHHIH
jgi:hypothetical protein